MSEAPSALQAFAAGDAISPFRREGGKGTRKEIEKLGSVGDDRSISIALYVDTFHFFTTNSRAAVTCCRLVSATATLAAVSPSLVTQLPCAPRVSDAVQVLPTRFARADDGSASAMQVDSR